MGRPTPMEVGVRDARSAILAFIGILAIACSACPEEVARPEFDCGLSALHVLSQLHGRPIDMATLRAHLPPVPAAGYSMKELREAAGSCGLHLEGISLGKDARAIDRPMLTFVHRGDHGHFLVVRPVGHSGNLVQVIDSTSPPIVLDKTSLLASTEWTGLALQPSRGGNGPIAIAQGIAVSSIVIGLASLLFGRLRWGSSSPQPSPPATSRRKTRSGPVPPRP